MHRMKLDLGSTLSDTSELSDIIRVALRIAVDDVHGQYLKNEKAKTVIESFEVSA